MLFEFIEAPGFGESANDCDPGEEIAYMTDRLIYESKKSKVFCRKETDSGQSFAVKVLNYEFPTPEDIAQFHNEFDIISGLSLAGVRNAIRKTRENHRHVLVMEWIEGESLLTAFRNKTDDIVDFLHIAIAAAGALEETHAHRIIHKDITPQNLLVDLQERRVWLIDFGISTNLNLKQPYVGNPEKIEGTLGYCSPEQTGRMNRSVDFRTDLYSLGATFYEILAGRPPFSGKDAMELVHAHLAQMPEPLHEANPRVPRMLSDIIARLMAKNAEDRYQSAHGLRRDLERCLECFQPADADIVPFRLGASDHSHVFRLPGRLYGRDEEVATIIGSFDACAAGEKKLLLVAGYSGVGKSALVHEVHRPITARKGYFCGGKFDQFQRATPYFAFLEAFRDLIDTLLSEREEKLEGIRESIRTALGEEGRVLTNVLNNLVHVVGEQPAVPEVGGAEAQNRFHYVFRKFVRVLATPEHPLVIFIDDLQWADSASLDLMEALMTDPEGGHLLLVCAYRENEVDAAHPFIRTVGDIRDAGLEVEMVEVRNLREEDLRDLLADALSTTTDRVAPLARLAHDKTRGNAFFATEFLKSLAEEGLLTFDFTSAEWCWDATEIGRRNISDNVVELMAGKVRRLETSAREILKLAACVGNRFDLATLVAVTDGDAAEVAGRLKPALAEGLVLPLGHGQFKFSHDRIQQAVYSLITEEEREQSHQRIGRMLLTEVDRQSREARIFDIVNHLNESRRLLGNRAERLELAALNLEAGRRAKVNSAFPTALRYLGAGIELIEAEPDAWSLEYDLSLALHTEATEAAYLSGEFDRMHDWYQQILSRARSILEKVKPYEIRILAYKAENRFMEAIQTGLEVLGQLGERFPGKPHVGHVLVDLLRTEVALRGRGKDELMALPLMENPEKQAAMRIIADITSSVYWGMPNLVPLIAFRLVRLSLKYGNHPVSCFAYGAYGVILCGVLGAMRRGYTFGQLALELLDKLNAKEWKAQIYVTPYALIFHWNEHVRNTLRPLQQSFQIGMETGLVEFACVNTNIYCIQAFLCGRPLERVAEETRAYSELYRQFKQVTNRNYNEVYRQAMLNLIGRSADPVKLTGEAYDEEVMMAQNEERSDKTGTFFIHFNKLLLCYYFRRYDEALDHATRGRKLLDAVLAKFEIPNHHFYEALTLLALAEREKEPRRERLLWRARRDMAKLKRWAKFAPENYRHKYELCRAETSRVRGRANEARIAYDRAIAGASENEYLHEQALAYELAGRFYAESERPVLAEFHLKAAYNTYREWGAGAKLRDLAETFPKYLSGGERGLESISGGGIGVAATTSMIDGSVLDITTVLKASTSISREVVPSKLLSVLMRIVLENAGAQRGFLLIDSEAGLRVQARGERGGEDLRVMQAVPLEECGDLSVSLVQFVERTGDAVVIADATEDMRCKGQAYVEEHRPRSILCVPVRNRGKSVGVLYLENNLAVGAFTRDRVDLLTLLSGQIAVSIDNAMLYEQLEQKVEERTAELAREKQKSEDLLHNILPVETAQELKQKGFAEARHYERVTVLFTDFKGFTELSAKLPPAQLVHEIDACFKAFDHIVERYGIEKIKTIGDAYMAAGGLPVPNSTHAEDVIRAALEIRDFMRDRNARGEGAGLDIRIGVHTGPVVAGIVGVRKFQYDIWGDTVNTASRMESSGEPGKVNVSQATRDLTRELFRFESRGDREAKGKGRMPMYFVEPAENAFESVTKQESHERGIV